MKKQTLTLLILAAVCLFALTPRLLIWLGIREPLPPQKEGYTLACDMTPEQLKQAKKICQDCQLESLQERYDNSVFMDGTHWQMAIYYMGGTEQWVLGRMAWPDCILLLKNMAVELTGDPDCF